MKNDRRDFLNALMTTALMTSIAGETADAQQTPSSAPPTLKQSLPAPFTGMDATFTLLTIQPGPPVSRPHTHQGFVLGYVIEGDYLFAINNDPPRVIHAGEIFYEAPEATHTTSANANPDQIAKVLAIVIGPLAR